MDKMEKLTDVANSRVNFAVKQWLERVNKL